MTQNGEDDTLMWPMSAVSRETGLSEHTLRAWERRFGFPQPVRLASGHRRYTSDQVHHLRLIAAALERGHRAGDVVTLPLERLMDLLGEGQPRSGLVTMADRPDWLPELLAQVQAFDRQAVGETLQRCAVALGLPRFLRERVTPLVRAVGQAWSDGDLEVAHEHFLSELLVDLLHAQRLPLEARAGGPTVVLATLPDEGHGLGLEMAALSLALAGWQVRMLGVRTPPEDIVRAARTAAASAVGLSVTAASATPATVEALAGMRKALSERVEVWVGGAGAAELPGLPAGVTRLDSLDLLDERATAEAVEVRA